jgi:hypothetical protein
MNVVVIRTAEGIIVGLDRSMLTAKYEYRKNRAKKLKVFSGEHKFAQTTHTVERSGGWQFPPAAALITPGGRLILAILERMVTLKGGSYLLTDTDSMLIVASEKGGLVPCSCLGGKSTVNAITWKQVEEICTQVNSLNPVWSKNSSRAAALARTHCSAPI